MAAQLQIDQERLPVGSPGTARTDGDASESVVTLTNTGSGSTTSFRLLWRPPGDTSAVETLGPTEDPKVWTFEKTPDQYGTYLIELIEDEGLVTEVREHRAFVVRTPNKQLVIPALNERGDPRASLIRAGTAQVEAAENNAVDYVDEALNSVPYAAWWRALHELTLSLDASAVAPFLHVRYVDGRTEVPPYLQTGSVDRPFHSIQGAIDSIPTTVDGYTPIGGVLLITGDVYMSESLTLPIGMAFVGLGAGTNVNIPGGLVVLGSVDCQGNSVEFRNVQVAGAVINAAEIRGREAVFFDVPNTAFGMRLDNCEVLAGFTADFATIANCPTLNGPLTFNTGSILNSTIQGAVLTGSILDIDRYSFERGKYAGGDFSGVTTINVVDRAGTFSVPETVEVDVPELGGSGVTAIDVSTTGTALEGIDVNQLVLANPTDDVGAELFRNVYVSALDTLRFTVAGPYVGGTVLFNVARLY